MATQRPTRLARIATAVALATAVGALLLVSGCRQAPSVEVVRVEAPETTTGRNVTPIKDELLDTIERGIEAWTAGDAEALAEVFSDRMMTEWHEARELDREEGVERVRVHSDATYIPTSLDQLEPRLRYEFLDESYFVDEVTGEPVTEPYNVEREVVFTLIREDGTLKINQMIGNPEALR